jgi:hypothetical protein
MVYYEFDELNLKLEERENEKLINTIKIKELKSRVLRNFQKRENR